MMKLILLLLFVVCLALSDLARTDEAQYFDEARDAFAVTEYRRTHLQR